VDLAGSVVPGPADEVDVRDIRNVETKVSYPTWERYEVEKAVIKARIEMGEITADEYDRQIKQLVNRLGI